MEYTQEQLDGFRTSFARKRRRQIILIVPLFAVIILVAAASDDSSSNIAGLPAAVVGTMGILLILGALAFSLYNWRCPACNGYLGRSASPRFCSKCGVPLQR